MNKVVDWGHWIVAALFAISGVDLVWSTVVTFPRVLREHPDDITYRVVSDVLIWLAILICAWGILKWRRWARSLGIVLAPFWCVAFGFAVSVGLSSREKLDFEWPLLCLAGCLVLVWFFLPAVRLEYSRRKQIA